MNYRSVDQARKQSGLRLVLTTGVPKAMASAAGIQKDSQMLIRQNTWWLA